MTCTGFAFIFAHLTCSTPATPPADTFCQQMRGPIYWHASDTRKTKEQVDRLNRRWKAVCRGGK